MFSNISSVANELLEYQRNISKAVKNGYDGIDDPEESKQWRFSGAFLYSLTVITTIGKMNYFNTKSIQTFLK